jgi:GT2 family glycosyltransferase
MSTVDVIVPCYRYGHFLKECVESVLTQTGSAVRVLVIDDASPDNSEEIARQLAASDSRVSLILHKTNQGHIATYNEGLDWATAEYLLLLSADDYVLPGAFERATAMLDAHPKASFSFGAAIMLESETGKTRTVQSLPVNNNRVLSGSQFIEESGGSNIVFASTAIVRTELQKLVGGYRSNLPHCGDMELWFRLAARGDVAYIAAPQGVYRRHGSNMSLSYMTRFMPDLVERRAVLDSFFPQYCHCKAGSLYRRARYSLGCSAIAFASAAYEDGSREASRQLIRFALSNSVAALASLPWCKFALKRVLGLRISRALRSLLGRNRTVFS